MPSQPVLEHTFAAAPSILPLMADQEREVMERYGSDETGPGPSATSPAVLVRVDGRAVGCVALSIGSQFAELKRMYVAPEARGRGLSRLLLAAIEEVARERGVSVIRLETGLAQPEAMALYSRSGYAPIPAYGYWKDAPDVRCFEKSLAAPA